MRVPSSSFFYGIDHKLTHVGEAVHLCGRIVCGIERGGIVGELVFLEEFRAFVFLNEEYVGRRVDFVVVGYGRCGHVEREVVDYVVVAGLSAIAFYDFLLWATVFRCRIRWLPTAIGSCEAKVFISGLRV